MASPTWHTWVWASSRRWWRTEKPGVPQSTGSEGSDTAGLLNNNGSSIFSFLETTILLTIAAVPIYLLTNSVGGFAFTLSAVHQVSFDKYTVTCIHYCHTIWNSFIALKNLCALTLDLSTLGIHWSFYCLHNLGFSTMSSVVIIQ